MNDIAPIPENEKARLYALKSYKILDTLPEEEYDAITKLASYICQVPIALITLLDENRQWFKSRIGLPIEQTPRNISFCQHAIMDEELMEISDAQTDKRFLANPLVTGEPHIRFYAGEPLITPDGFALGTLCVIDVQPKTLTREQKEAMHTLANAVVSQLVLRDQKKKLEQEKEKAQASLKIKEQFLANMSHEIRTPLNGIVGLTDLLLSTPLNDEQYTFMQYIKKSADNLMSIVSDILDLSRIESGKTVFESVPFHVPDLFASTIGLYRAKAAEKNLRLEAHLAADVPETLTGDPARLSQVLSHLIDNAVKFTETGKISVSITKTLQTTSHVTLLFTVQDTGIGVEPDKQKMIFDSFTQADNATTRKYGGIGLGLAISKWLIDQQSGKIWLTSQPGEGSRFQFTLAFNQLKPDETQLGLTKATFSAPVKIQVLVVEDNEVNQLIITKILKTRSYAYALAANGLQAIEMLHKNDYDIILMDIQMPVMDGYQAINYIRNNVSAKSKIPIIALTAHVVKEEIEKCFQAGASDYLVKPFQADELVEKIDHQVSLHKNK